MSSRKRVGRILRVLLGLRWWCWLLLVLLLLSLLLSASVPLLALMLRRPIVRFYQTSGEQPDSKAALRLMGAVWAALLVLGGDVIRGFVFAMLWGVFVGCYSTIYVAKNIVLWLGVKRDWSKPAKDKPEMSDTHGTPFQDVP